MTRSLVMDVMKEAFDECLELLPKRHPWLSSESKLQLNLLADGVTEVVRYPRSRVPRAVEGSILQLVCFLIELRHRCVVPRKPNVLVTLQVVSAECDAAREAGQREYAHDPNRSFRNFDDIGMELGLRPEVVLWVYAKKHIDGIVSYLDGHRSQREGVEGRINDLIVYLCLLLAMDRSGRLET